MPEWAERVGKAKIAALWAEGLSMKRIAELLGAPSRSAVAGYIAREGLERSADLPKPARQAKPRVRRPRRVASPPTAPIAITPPPPRRLPKGPVTIMELSERTCRYILGDVNGADTLFCAKETVDGSPYCRKHCEACFTVLQQRRAA